MQCFLSNSYYNEIYDVWEVSVCVVHTEGLPYLPYVYVVHGCSPAYAWNAAVAYVMTTKVPEWKNPYTP